MFYIDEKNRVYQKIGDEFVRVGVEAKNKVIVTKELESVTVVTSSEKVKSVEATRLASLDDLIAIFHIDEDHPLVVEEKKAPAPKKATPAKKKASK